uniref:chemokine-like protein TAFA-4b isoform X1 n=1 Tax=Scatophagus argus TaxID=75038 RepID=UPI001ED7E383|nr:chemokine-like protein TAFA-4b isoform X1 [Scatophagus argus]
MTSVRKEVWGWGGCTWELVNWAGAVARVLNGEDGLASHFSCPIDPCSGGATGAQLSLLHHYTITLISISPATTAPLCAIRAQGDELVWSVRQKTSAIRVSLGELRTFYDFLLTVVLRWDTVRPWHVGPHRCCESSAFSPGSGGLLLWRGCSPPPPNSSPPHPCFSVFVRGLREVDRRLKRISQFSGKTKSVELKQKVAKRSTVSPGSFTIPCDHVFEFIDLGGFFCLW